VAQQQLDLWLWEETPLKLTSSFAVLRTILFAIAITGGEMADAAPSAQQVDAMLVQALNGAVANINRRGPVMTDKETRWDRSEAGPGARITHFYSLPNYSSQAIGSMVRQNLGISKQRAVSELCSNKEMLLPVQYGATVVHVYSGNDGVEMGRYEINKTDCK
jgi:hypothetical protein